MFMLRPAAATRLGGDTSFTILSVPAAAVAVPRQFRITLAMIQVAAVLARELRPGDSCRQCSSSEILISYGVRTQYSV